MIRTTLYHDTDLAFTPVQVLEYETPEEIYSEVFRIIRERCEQSGFHSYYIRSWTESFNGDGDPVTVFDYGSHTQFYTLFPAVPVPEPVS